MIKSNHSFRIETECGIGCIEELYVCNDCGHQVLIGTYNKTDGSGDFYPNHFHDSDFEHICIEEDAE